MVFDDNVIFLLNSIIFTDEKLILFFYSLDCTPENCSCASISLAAAAAGPFSSISAVMNVEVKRYQYLLALHYLLVWVCETLIMNLKIVSNSYLINSQNSQNLLNLNHRKEWVLIMKNVIDNLYKFILTVVSQKDCK